MPKERKYIIALTAILALLLILSTAFCSCETLMNTLQYSCEEGGYIEGITTQKVLAGSMGSSVKAVADEGYKFVGWTDGIKTDWRQDKDVTGDLSVTAQFAKIEQEISHICESVCLTCGKCTNAACNETACAEKCDCVVIPPHTCDSLCNVCGGCTDNNCNDTACSVKCTCVVTPSHTCESICSTCGKCTDNNCNDQACSVKCTCVAELPHDCESVCPTCGKCTNAACNETACTQKCDCVLTPAHMCKTACNVCGGCTDNNCNDTTCSAKCTCVVTPSHTCESVCNKCGKCTNDTCNETACAEKCDCVVIPPHTCDSLCNVCGGCTNTNCNEQACSTKCNCVVVPPHTCGNICPTCGNCLNNDCEETACSVKCNCVVVPPHTCESVCDVCGKCTNDTCNETACAEKCDCPVIPPQPQTYTVTYDAGEGGTIYYDKDRTVITQTVTAGGSAGVNIVVKPGYQFWRWSDGRTYNIISSQISRKDENINEDITVTALYKPCSIIYSNNGGTRILYNGVEYGSIELFMNEDGTFDEVTAVSSGEGYRFTNWSDGVTTATRKDTTAFVGRKFIRANAESVPIIRTVKYLVDDNFGGRIVGDAEQTITVSGSTQSVRAVADDGYIFTGWSDFSTQNVRNDVNVERNLEFYAFFELIEKTFTFNYNGANQPLQTSITLNRYDKLSNVKFPVPQREGYTFCGWYLDTDFKNKVADANGKYYYGLMSFSVSQTELYARWKKLDEDETVPVYKVLLIVNDKVVARLWSSETQDYVDVNYAMLTVERRTMSLVSYWFDYLLNDWFTGDVVFEVDTYYTTEVLTMQSRDPDNWDGKKILYSLFPDDVPEIADIFDNYDGRLLFYGLGNKDDLQNNNTVGAEFLYNAYVNLDAYIGAEHYLTPYYYRTASETQIMEEKELIVLSVAMHEFCHIVDEQTYVDTGIGEHYHTPLYDLYRKGIGEIHIIKLFLRGEISQYGNYKGILPEYWQNIENWKRI